MAQEDNPNQFEVIEGGGENPKTRDPEHPESLRVEDWEIARQAARRILEPTANSPDAVAEQLGGPTDVQADLGYGNRKKERLVGLGQGLVARVMELDLAARERESRLQSSDRDVVQFKLFQALSTIGEMAAKGCRSIDELVELIAPGEKVGNEAKKRLIRIHDSLDLLDNAFNFVVSNSEGERSKEHVEEFTDNFHSSLWTEEAAAEAQSTFEGIDEAYKIIGELSSPKRDSIHGFIDKTQIKLLEKAGIKSLPRHATGAQKQGRESRIRNLRALAAQDWNALPRLREEPDDLGRDAAVFSFSQNSPNDPKKSA